MQSTNMFVSEKATQVSMDATEHTVLLQSAPVAATPAAAAAGVAASAAAFGGGFAAEEVATG